MTTVTVPSRFNGPPASGQGGYSSGILVAYLEGPAAVSLRRPIPLDVELEVRVGRDDPAQGEGGGPRAERRGTARAYTSSGELVAEAVPAPPLAPWDAPPVSLEAARRAKKSFAASADGVFDHCFVCGRARSDGLGVCAGPVADADLVATPWTPPAWTAGEDGAVLPEFVWAALDCPGYFAVHGTDLALAFLARQQSEVHAPVRVGVEYVVVGRLLGREGRKGFAATAILDPTGEPLAHGEQLTIVPREAMSHE
ncbi:MAG TPA: hypothetical protein VHB53_09160 [Solirubrobacterales bacterium]|nr:hypothetical protein [Solirubrobacterales bacterium]